MAGIEILDMRPEDEYFVGTCSHRHESSEIDACGARRVAWLKAMHPQGVRAKVALDEGQHAGFLFAMPIEVSPWGPEGEDLITIPCLYVAKGHEGRGAGGALLEGAEAEARRQGRGGIVLYAVERQGWWFMPAAYFARNGYEEAARRGAERLLWKRFRPEVPAPRFFEPDYRFQAVRGKVVVDLFWNRFCLTSDVEAERVREVAREFGDRVVVNEFPACDPEVLRTHRIARGIYVQGEVITWGYEAPRDGIRDAIRVALSHLAP